ncbi:MAG: molybdopterin-dependent oxidoreductase [Actinobacteria bacterium]|nr:molybdopterin-dependent oxidoreductase [Actinomycetota bacterium]
MPEARDVTKNEVQDGVQLHEGEVRIVLDGRNVVARKGEKIITAAERAGVFIPRFCYHSRMKPVGVCRMCLVEVTGPRGATLQPACYADVAEGMEIATASDKAKKAQEGVLEFLLINHPLDCPVCDKGGECPLQDQAYSYGPGESRFIDEKRHWAKPTSINSLVLLDRERCIQCSRCTRFAAEVAGEPAIDFVSRGDSIEVGTFPGHAMSPYFSGNIVQICPVGALTAVPFRFSSRPWDTEQVESSCMRCALQCRIAVQSQAGKLSRVLGIDSEPVNHGWLCDKGRFSFEAIYSEERVCEPMIIKSGSGGGTTADAGIGASEDGDVKSRHADGDDDSAVGESGNAGATSGDLVPATWNEALTEVSNRLADTLAARGPSSIAIIGGANLVNEDAYAWVKLAKSVVRTDSVDALLGDGMDAGLLATLDRATIDEACSAKCLLLLCGDLREELPVLYLRVREAAISGSTRLVELSQRPSSLSRYAEISKMYMPGDAPAGVDRLGDAISAMTGASGAGLVVAAGKASMAQGEAELGATIMSVMARWPAAKFLPVARKANVMGALETGMAPGMLPGGIGLEEGRDRYESAWGALPVSKGLDAHGILEAASHGDIEVLFLLGADPIDDFRDSQLARRALERTPFVVAVDAFETASSRMAHVFLPAALPYEKAGTVTNVEGRVTSVAPKVIPPALAWPEWVVASRLAEAFGADLGFGSQDEIATEMAALVPGWDMLSREPAKSAVLRDGAVIHCQDDDAVTAPAPSLGQVRQVPASLASNACETGGCMDPIAFPGIASVDQQGAPMVVGLVREDVPASAAVRLQGLDPEVLLESQASGYGSAQDGPAGNGGAGAGETRRIAGAAGSDYASPSINQDPRFPLRLVVARTLYGNGTLVGATRSLAPLSVPSRVLVNPEDAPASATRLSPGGGAEVGLGTDGEPGGEVRQPAGTMRVRVISGVGEATLPMEVDESVPKGSVIVQSTPSELVAAADGVTFVRVESC